MYYAVMTANVTPVDSQCPNYPSNHRLQINLCSETAAPQQQHNALPTQRRGPCRHPSGSGGALGSDVFRHASRVPVFKPA